jgi:nitrate reductase NapD
MVISSFVLRCYPAQTDSVACALGAWQGVELHAQEDERIVVTVEADSLDQGYRMALELSQLEGVLAADLVYCNFEDECD